MRFLKDIIARKSDFEDKEFYLDPEAEESENTEDIQSDATEDIDEDLSAQPEDDETSEYLDIAAHIADAVNDSEPEAEADAEMDEASDEAAENEIPDQDEVIVKIWEMFKEENEAPVEEAPAEEQPDTSQHELAREAMNSMIDPGPETEDLAARPPAPAPSMAPTPEDQESTDFAPPAPDQAVQRAGRAKTRMLGFHSSEAAVPDVFDRADAGKDHSTEQFPVGWLVVIKGPGRGSAFTLQYGVSTIGRDDGQTIKLDFGDNSISRENHASIAYDEDLNEFFIGHSGKSNLVRLNGKPLLSTEELSSADLIRIGETTLRFVGFCSPDFVWDLTDDEEILNASVG